MQIFTALYSIISTLIFPQHEDRSRLEPAEHTKEISQNRFHIQLFCFNTNKKYAI